MKADLDALALAGVNAIESETGSRVLVVVAERPTRDRCAPFALATSKGVSRGETAQILTHILSHLRGA